MDAVLTHGHPDDMVSRLPVLLAKYRDAATPPRMFNLARSACQSFARSIAGPYSDLWRDVASVGQRGYRKKKRGGLPVDEARKIADGLGQIGQMWWTMCCTGMGPKEYWHDGYRIEKDRIRIFGEKREARFGRFVPRIVTPVRALITYKPYRRHLAAVNLQPYDARRTFSHWMEMAGIPKSRRRFYLGHQAKDVTDGYEDHSPEYYLAGDCRLLKEYVGAAPQLLRAVP